MCRISKTSVIELNFVALTNWNTPSECCSIHLYRSADLVRNNFRNSRCNKMRLLKGPWMLLSLSLKKRAIVLHLEDAGEENAIFKLS